MINLANEYASKNPEFNDSVKSLLNQYNKKDIDEEVLADISGQLFGNQEFINNLSMEKPTVFKQVYNKIIEWANKLTENSKESLFIKDLKNKWESAYRNKEENTNIKTEINFSLFDDYDERTKENLNSTKRDIIVKSNLELEQLIDEALGIKNSNKALHFGIIKNSTISYIKDNLQNLPKDKQNFIKYDNYDLIMNQSEIRHLTDEKNITSEEVKKYISKIPEIINSSNYISYTINNKNEGLRFKKILDDGTYVSFILVSNKQHSFKIKTIFLDKEDYEEKKRSMSLTSDASKAPNKTSETDRAFASFYANNISQSNDNVKSDISTKYSMQEKDNDTQELDNNSYNLGKNSLIEKYSNLNLNEDISKLDGIPAIKLNDGSILPIKTENTPHVIFIKNNNIDVNDIHDGGWITNGIYESTDTSDTLRYVEQEKAKQRVEKKHKIKELESKQKSFEELTEVEKDELKKINKELQTERVKIYSTKPETTDIEKKQAQDNIAKLNQRKKDLYNGNLKIDKTVPLTEKSVFEVSFDENELNKDNTLDEQVQRLINIVNEGIDKIDDQAIDESIEEIKYYKDHYIDIEDNIIKINPTSKKCCRVRSYT